MKEITSTTVEVKLSDGHEDKYVLVYDGEQIIELAEPGTGKVGTPPRHTMLVGTKEEIEAEIARLKLKPKRPRRPVEHRPPVENPKHEANEINNDSGKSENNL
jgi:hypothetical protein